MSTNKHEEDFILPTSGLPPIPGHVVQAIKAGKFIDLSDLLPEALREMQFDDSKDTKSREEGKKKKYVINTPLDWSVAYAIFMAVSAHFDPPRAFVLSAYASIVLSLANMQKQPSLVRLPITISIMAKIKCTLAANPSDFSNVLIWAACCTGFFGLKTSTL